MHRMHIARCAIIDDDDVIIIVIINVNSSRRQIRSSSGRRFEQSLTAISCSPSTNVIQSITFAGTDTLLTLGT